MKRIKEWLEDWLMFSCGFSSLLQIQIEKKRKLRLLEYPLIFVTIFIFFPLWMIIGAVMHSQTRWLRPLRRAIMRYTMRTEAKAEVASAGRPAVNRFYKFPTRVQWDLAEQSPWNDAAPAVLAQATPYAQVKACLGFAEMYAWNGRLEEAQAASHLGKRIADEWVRDNPEKARQALEMRRNMFGWQFRPQLEKYEEPTTQSFKEFLAEGLNEAHAVNAVDGGMMQQWRNAHIAVALLEEVVTRRQRNQLLWPLPATRKEKQICIISEQPFGIRFAYRIGMTKRQCDGLFQRSTKLPHN